MNSEVFDLSRIADADCVSHIEFHRELDSTSTLARELARELSRIAETRGPNRPALVLTELQTAGRGRGSHRWDASPGALTFTLAYPVGVLPSEPSARILTAPAAGLGVRDAVASRLPRGNVLIKWPNDVVVDRAKISGILTEIVAAGATGLLLIGIGVNVNNRVSEAAADGGFSATSLFELLGESSDLTCLLIELIRNVTLALEQLQAEPDLLLARINRVSALAGRRITIDAGRRQITGVCGPLTREGLQVQTAVGVERVVAGSVRDW